ncbi:hypothetical protein THAOC_21453 [Thalassiosira oceanica]|uniref:Uncharacterized protein n=1 Tax=Thalassiosira oceanica TaxID=159749 RepID=K0RZD1_THAOC|nr:hypothetical protein THAOC_21453 [Thalassiosira oceanica]|eukprot:EJK58420.1 hypothetical protein THAOC_21453 [Thalassiosira oceanica]
MGGYSTLHLAPPEDDGEAGTCLRHAEQGMSVTRSGGSAIYSAIMISPQRRGAVSNPLETECRCVLVPFFFVLNGVPSPLLFADDLLTRFVSDDDGDRDEPPKTPRRNRKTIGEELWAIHQVRSRGLPPDLDVDDDSDANREETPKVKKYYLRSRKGKKPNADN